MIPHKIKYPKNKRFKNSVVVFYDPVVKYNHKIDFSIFEKEKTESKDSLRAQVRDFINWFKNEKVWW